MPVERAAGGTSLIDVLDRVLDKGIVIDAWVRVSLVGIDLITVEARIVVASIDTYLKYSEAVGQVAPVSSPRSRAGDMRNSSPKMPRSGLSSRVPALRADWSDVGVLRSAAKRIGRRLRASRVSRVAVGDETRERTTTISRRGCACSRALSAGPRSPTVAQVALQWLGEVPGRRPSRSASCGRPASSRCSSVGGARPAWPFQRHVVHRVARRVGQSARHRSQTPQAHVLPGRALGRRSAGGVRRRHSKMRPFHVVPLGVSAFSRRPVRSAPGRRQRAAEARRCTGSSRFSARSSIRSSVRRRSPKAIASRAASGRCSTASSTRSPTRFC